MKEGSVFVLRKKNLSPEKSFMSMFMMYNKSHYV